MRFGRIRLKLTIRNTIVFIVILISLNGSVYAIMREMLFSQIDKPLLKTREKVTFTLTKDSIHAEVGATHLPVIQLFWTADGRVLPMPGMGAFSEAELAVLNEKAISSRVIRLPDNTALREQIVKRLDEFPSSLRGPITIRVGERYYREMSYPFSLIGTNGGIMEGIDGYRYNVNRVQLLIDITAEIGMLKRLKEILLFGGAIGLIVTVAAGYYLANRALIPIRLSMERQQQFVSDASHELRTPLSVIQAHSELLLRHPDRTIEQESEHISTVLKEAGRMNKLVGSLLTLARSDSSQLELERKQVLFDRIVQENVGKLRMLAELKGVSVHADIDERIPMAADEERLHQLLVIVLDNAVKYTPEGGIVSVLSSKQANSALLVISDTGIGIAPDSLPRVFDRFYRGDKSRSRHENGTGLGLAIAKWIVERHGGRIRIESKLSSGTQVFITLPL